MKNFYIIFLLLTLNSCRLYEHLQHMEAPEILEIFPSDEIVDVDSLEKVSLKFSEEMDRKRTENAFTMSEDDEDMTGVFGWSSGNIMDFTPYHGFKRNREYKISLRKSSEDIWGNSLNQDYYHLFRTGEDRVPPYLISSLPEDYSFLDAPRTPLVLTFSEAIDQTSFRNALGITPDIPMEQSWNDSGTTVILTPLEDYQAGEEYRLTLSDSLTDLALNGLISDITLLFRTVESSPLILTALSVAGSGTNLQTEGIGVNGNLEKDMQINGTLNRSLNFDERSSLIDILPSKSFEIDWSIDFTAFTLSFSDNLDFSVHYELSILDEKYILLVNGPESKPLSLVRVVFCPDDSAGVPLLTSLSLNSSLGASDSTTAFFDFYIGHAEGAVLNLASFMDALSFKSSVLTFENYGIEVYDGLQTPAPSPLPALNESILRVSLGITDSALPGTVTLSLDEGFHDSFENTLSEDWSLSLSQP